MPTLPWPQTESHGNRREVFRWTEVYGTKSPWHTNSKSYDGQRMNASKCRGKPAGVALSMTLGVGMESRKTKVTPYNAEHEQRTPRVSGGIQRSAGPRESLPATAVGDGLRSRPGAKPGVLLSAARLSVGI